tara:strand:- start:1702 stop:2508 length:807 start_codon:yes stop_codon:yes gene_type:complete
MSALLLTLFTNCTLYTKSACIIVHGTWSQDSSWYRPAGDFFSALESCNKEIELVDEIIPFSWSGKLGHPAQLQAAQELEKVIQEYDFVIIVAHSHGATVGMICSQILFSNDTNGNNLAKIKRFYSLGVPVNESTVTPNMSVVKKFYNLFSFGDHVQTVHGMYERIFTNVYGIYNLSVELFGKHPSHTQLHHPAVGAFLLKIDDYFAEKKLGNFHECQSSFPGNITFFDYQYPQYHVQHNQEELLAADKQSYNLAALAFFRTHTLCHDR